MGELTLAAHVPPPSAQLRVVRVHPRNVPASSHPRPVHASVKPIPVATPPLPAVAEASVHHIEIPRGGAGVDAAPIRPHEVRDSVHNRVLLTVVFAELREAVHREAGPVLRAVLRARHPLAG